VRWREVRETGRDPRTGAEVESVRQESFVDHELPMKDAYAELVRGIVLKQ
jgi:hypothetical protein